MFFSGLFAGHEPARRSRQEFSRGSSGVGSGRRCFEISRVGLGRVGSGGVGNLAGRNGFTLTRPEP